MLFLHVDYLVKFYVKGKNMLWFFQSLKTLNAIAMRKRIMLQDLSTIEYAVRIRMKGYCFSLESCLWSIAWNIHVLLYKIYMKATITSNQPNTFTVYFMFSFALDCQIWGSIFKSIHLLKRNTSFCPKEKILCSFFHFSFSLNSNHRF